MIRTLPIFLVALTASAHLYSQESDRLLDIMQRELNREVAEFARLPQPPYFIGYRIDDVEDVTISASFGSLVRSSSDRRRLLHVRVRVGDYLVDNSHPVGNESTVGLELRQAQRMPIPLDDTDDAIRYLLWRSTDEHYRMALQGYSMVRSMAASKQDEKAPADFSKEPVEKYYQPHGPALNSLFNKNDWEQRMRDLSSLFLADASIVEGDIVFTLSKDRRYFVSSEGASVVQEFISSYINVSASVRANDGDIVPLHQTYYAPTPAGLPSAAAISGDIRSMIVTLQKLKTAPLADPYTGPAVLEGSVSGVFFHEIFGHRVEGHRLRSEADGQTFKTKVDQKILPETISVYCDPTIDQFAGTHLNGVYAYDDEGVKSRRVTIVEKGALKTFLMSRAPVEKFAHSNGHGRASSGLTPVSRQSNLFVNATRTRSASELRQMLIKECQRQKKPYGYLFRSVVGGFTVTDRYNPNAFNIFPTEVYRVYVDGRPDELVRGVDLIGTPLVMFAEIAAVGDTHGVFTGFCGAESGYVPVSAISPALFVRRIETQKKPKARIEAPVLAAPMPTTHK